MRRAWLGLVLGCLACGEKEGGVSGVGGGAGETGTEAAGAPGEAGAASGGSNGVGGSKAGGGAGSGGALPMGGKATVEAGSDAGGATDAGAGGVGMPGAGGSGEDCNDLQLIEMAPTCTVLGAPVPEQGGTLVEGTFALVSYQMPICLAGLEQTLHIEETAPNTYHVETIANLGDVRANSTFVRQGLVLSSTSTCGAEEVNEPYGYTAYEDQGVPHLRLANQGTFTYRRVSD